MKYHDDRCGLILWLGATAAPGSGFLILEAYDFYRLAFIGGAPPQRSGFLSVYFLLTGTHWMHVACGVL